MDFILFGKTIVVVNKKFGFFLANQLRKRESLYIVASVVEWLKSNHLIAKI